MMAQLALTQFFVNLMADGTAVSAGSTNRKRSNAIDGGTRTYGFGRRRGLSVLGDIGQVTFTLNLVSQANITLLESWRGRAVQVRNNVGERWVGMYWKLDNISDQKGLPGLYMCDINLDTITWDDSV